MKVLTDAEKRYEELKPAPEAEYEILEGKDGKWKAGSGETLKFRGSGELKDFVEVRVDGQKVDQENYKLSEGSTIVEFTSEYLETLPAGEHKLMMVWTDGTAETKFTIEAKDEPKKDDPKQDDSRTPKTGDQNNAMLWLIMALAALGVMAAAGASLKKKTGR